MDCVYLFCESSNVYLYCTSIIYELMFMRQALLRLTFFRHWHYALCIWSYAGICHV